jgi:hypothetical protein
VSEERKTEDGVPFVLFLDDDDDDDGDIFVATFPFSNIANAFEKDVFGIVESS